MDQGKSKQGITSVSRSPEITVRFHAPSADLRRYFTTFYYCEFTLPKGERVHDSLQPEWANLIFFVGDTPTSAIGGKPAISGAHFVATGPSSLSVDFAIGSNRFWGIGLLPLGWAKFVRAPANAHANLVTDGKKHPTFASFLPLAASLYAAAPDETAELARLESYFRVRLAEPSPDEERILAIHSALVDPEVASVGSLVERTRLGQRMLERLCARHFGFSPKLLLRRQRFMRSLAQFMLDPSLKWVGALDGQYHDQAQFVRDFHDFMGASPSAYAANPHPVLEMFMRERMRTAGSAVQTTDGPDGTALGDK
jgi:AraC-like DNA-binding protein